MASTQTEHAASGYSHLVERPQSWRRQLYLQGRNMSVGQLVATMRANGLSAQEEAADLHIPIAHIQEALSYYELHHDLIDAELREDRRYLQEKGYYQDNDARDMSYLEIAQALENGINANLDIAGALIVLNQWRY